MGELGKWVTMSPQRVRGITESKEDIQIHIHVAERETVLFSYLNRSMLVHVSCYGAKYRYRYISVAAAGCFPEMGINYWPKFSPNVH